MAQGRREDRKQAGARGGACSKEGADGAGAEPGPHRASVLKDADGTEDTAKGSGVAREAGGALVDSVSLVLEEKQCL